MSVQITDEERCPQCDGALWLLFEKGDHTMAEPCATCKPREWDAYQQGRLNKAYFRDRDGSDANLTPDERRARNKQKAKEKFDL